MTEVTQKIADANARQVGGDHYKTGGTELWDLFGPESIIFYATRYVQRWRKKDGVKDLEKAVHCVQKLREIAPAWHAYNGPLAVAEDLFESWMDRTGLDDTERGIVVRVILHWRDDVELEYAQRQIEYLIRKENNKSKGKVGKHGKVFVTNTPRAGETPEQIHARERRVPRYDADVKHSAADALRNSYGDTYPWIVDADEVPASLCEGGGDLFKLFYTRRGAHWVLDPSVTSSTILRPLRHCYVPRGDGHWTLDVRKCPIEVRDCFPDLRASLNMKEWEEAPEWQRVLYTWDEMDTKYKLAEINRAWHVEAE